MIASQNAEGQFAILLALTYWEHANQKRGAMTRGPRRASSTGIYHVTSRGAGRRILFEDDDDHRFFLAKISEYADKASVRILAWCFMPNHIHMLLECGDVASLTQMMRSLGTSYGRYYNGHHGHVGPVFQDRFHSFPVESDAYLLELARYIHLNPTRAGIAKYDEYPWSSYLEYIDEPILCVTDRILGLLGDSGQISEFHACAPDDEWEMEVTIDDGAVIPKRRAIPDSEAIRFAKDEFGATFADTITSLPSKERNAVIKRLRRYGMSVRQIERLTGIGRGIIQRISV